MIGFVGLRAKLYATKMDNGDETKKCKGTPKTTIKRDLKYEHYLECIKTQKSKNVNSNVIRSHDHTMYSETIKKTALSTDDDKRIILNDGTSRWPLVNGEQRKCTLSPRRRVIQEMERWRGWR